MKKPRSKIKIYQNLELQRIKAIRFLQFIISKIWLLVKKTIAELKDWKENEKKQFEEQLKQNKLKIKQQSTVVNKEVIDDVFNLKYENQVKAIEEQVNKKFIQVKTKIYDQINDPEISKRLQDTNDKIQLFQDENIMHSNFQNDAYQELQNDIEQSANLNEFESLIKKWEMNLADLTPQQLDLKQEMQINENTVKEEIDNNNNFQQQLEQDFDDLDKQLKDMEDLFEERENQKKDKN